ncbi:hypothetical protein Bca52824_020194 [Brassica carinata]|uniref:Disease resistance protein n=1 Tax=Brassica carinata TaxID=52824 RepID=A0A8X7VTU9_BRACI|nr:hypothetical protein Bca52824_020194 [Brassica carinata]
MSYTIASRSYFIVCVSQRANMAEELLSFALQKLWDLLSQEYEQFQGVKDQVTELKTDLYTLKSFLKDADAKKHTSEVVKHCLDMIKEIIYDAEDIIETFILKDELGKHGGIKKRIRRLAGIFPERRGTALEIGSLSKRIAKVICDMEKFGVQKIIADVRDLQPSQQRVEFARKYESNLVGMEENVEKLVGHLVEEDDVQVVSMTGMGGLGKTTIARQAFHHDKVIKKFDRLSWVSVSQVFNRKNVWQTILLNYRSKEEEKEILKMTEARLQDELFQLLENSKSLIVFDDIWKEEDWDQIKEIFPSGKGWKVLLTSRNERVAGHGETYIINFKPECLSDNDSWTLFQKIAMPRNDLSELNNVDKQMEEMGKQMIKHCGGLPLAIRVLGGVLSANYNVHYWKRVSKNIGSHLLEGRTNLNKDNDNLSVKYILSLSFEELPVYLKYCFLYMAHYPEDYEIYLQGLFLYWAAEGLLMYNDEDTIEDVGDSYIEELVRRNMVVSKRDNTTSRYVTCCLHDLMRDLCLSKAKEENFLQIVSPSAHPQSTSISRRFFINDPDTFDVTREINNPKARSLVVVQKVNWEYAGSWKLSRIDFTRLQLLRILHLTNAKFKGRKLPDSIGELIHLRYLNLYYVEVSHLPSSLRNLKLLIYLNLNIYGCFVPNDLFMGMKELRYLILPWDMRSKKKLKLSHLVKLETLKNFSTENCNLEDLRGMAKLRTLGIELTGESSLETLSATIGGLTHLEDLYVIYEGAKGTKEWRTLLDFSNLKQLALDVRIKLLSEELQFPSRVTRLYLSNCSLEEDPMPILEKLSQLKELEFLPQCFSGKRMVCSAGGFPQLQRLSFWGLKEWEEWIVEDGSMPLLHDLYIRACPKLKELPDGLQFITALKELTLSTMGDQWKEKLLEGGEDYYKVKHIPSVGIY